MSTDKPSGIGYGYGRSAKCLPSPVNTALVWRSPPVTTLEQETRQNEGITGRRELTEIQLFTYIFGQSGLGVTRARTASRTSSSDWVQPSPASGSLRVLRYFWAVSQPKKAPPGSPSCTATALQGRSKADFRRRSAPNSGLIGGALHLSLKADIGCLLNPRKQT